MPDTYVFNKQLLSVIFYSSKITLFVFDYGINASPTVGNPENIDKCKEENQNSLNFHSFDKRILTHEHIFFPSFTNAYIYIHS